MHQANLAQRHALPARDRALDILSAPMRAQTWRATAFNLASLPIGLVTATAVTVGLSLGVALLPVLVGLPVLLGVLAASRWLAGTELRRLHWLDGRTRRPAPSQPRPEWTWPAVRARLADPTSWRSAAYAVIAGPLGIVTFTIATASWAYAAAAATEPFWNGDGGSGRLLGFVAERPVDHLAITCAGLVAFFVAPWLNRGAARAHAALADHLLPTRHR